VESPCAHNADMRAAAWGVPVLLICGCAARAAVPQAAAPVPLLATSAPNVTAIWDVDRATPASRDVHLTFVAAACSAVKRVVVEETAERVVITLDQAGRNGKDCTEPRLRHRTVRLAAPLGGRALYDGGVAPAQLVRAVGHPQL
jgi:hypothetical protein